MAQETKKIIVQMKGYVTGCYARNGLSEDGIRASYGGYARTHLFGEVRGRQIDIHEPDFRTPYVLTIRNEDRKSSKEPVRIPFLTILRISPLLNQAGERRRENGFDLFEVEIELVN